MRTSHPHLFMAHCRCVSSEFNSPEKLHANVKTGESCLPKNDANTYSIAVTHRPTGLLARRETDNDPSGSSGATRKEKFQKVIKLTKIVLVRP